MDVLEKIFPAASEPVGEGVFVGVNEKQLKEYEMNVTQISTCPLRIRIQNQAAGSGGNGGGHDFALVALSEDFAVFVKAPAEPVRQPPADPNA